MARRPALTRMALMLAGLTALSPSPSDAQSGTWVKFSSGNDTHSGNGTTCAIDTRRGQAVLFGMWHYPACFGVSCFGYYDADVTAFARFGPDPVLVPPTTLPGSPGRRSDACAAYDSLADQVWLFGGRSVNASFCRAADCPERVPLDDLWRLDLSVDPPQWHEVLVSGARPPGRHDAALVVDPIGRRLLLFGGHDSSGTAFADLWEMPLEGPYAWAASQPSGPGPSARWSATALFDRARKRVLVVGGFTPTGSATDVWSLDVSGPLVWSPLAVGGAAPAAVSRAMLDPGRDLVLTYGGAANLSTFNLAGSPAWAPLSTTGGPSTDNLGGFGYDPVHDVLWLPYHETFPTGRFDGNVAHWLFTLATPPSVPVLDPVLDSVRYVRGSATLSWRLRPRRTDYHSATVEWSPSSGVWLPALTVPAPDTSGTGVQAVIAGLVQDQDVPTRVAWLDGAFPQAGGASLVHTSPGPIDMAFDIAADSIVRGGGVHIVWHVHDDSLSRLSQPSVQWNAEISGWVTLLTDWPDANYNLSFGSYLAPDPPTADFRLRWDGPLGEVTGGYVTLSHEGPPPPPPPPPPTGDSLFISPPRPNPVTTAAGIDYRLPRAGPGTITLHDLHGRIVRRWTVTAASAHSYPLEVQGLDPGLYLLNLRQAGRNTSTRIVIFR